MAKNTNLRFRTPRDADRQFEDRYRHQPNSTVWVGIPNPDGSRRWAPYRISKWNRIAGAYYVIPENREDRPRFAASGIVRPRLPGVPAPQS